MNEPVPVTFTCGGEVILGLLHPGDAATGVVIVVGGPQYRVGSHRQFLALARRLSAAGLPVLRFDCRGMGDSSGEFPGFEGLDDDIRAAVDCLLDQAPQVRQVALWGLCDAASAILMYAHRDTRIGGLIILNPWVRTEAGLAQAYVKHYYLRRLFDRRFWSRLFSGDVGIVASLKGLLGNLRRSAAGHSESGSGKVHYVDRMRAGLAAFRGPVLCVLSGQDITATEFDELCQRQDWRELMARPGVRVQRFPDANHTFASDAARAGVEQVTLDWLADLAGPQGSVR